MVWGVKVGLSFRRECQAAVRFIVSVLDMCITAVIDAQHVPFGASSANGKDAISTFPCIVELFCDSISRFILFHGKTLKLCYFAQGICNDLHLF